MSKEWWCTQQIGRWAAIVLLGGAVAASTIASAQQPRGPTPPVNSTDLALTAPDPPALRSADQIVLTFRYEAGKVGLLRVRRVHLAQIRTTPRVAGRYAVELLSGRTLVERVRFDFPLLGADELAGKPRQYNAPPRFESKAIVDYDVWVPDSSRFSRARLVDRATGRLTPIPWPPDLPEAGTYEAGAESGRSGDSGPIAAEAGDASRPDGAYSLADARSIPDAKPLPSR